MITCPACRQRNYEGELFCTDCGARLWQMEASAAPPTTTIDPAGAVAGSAAIADDSAVSPSLQSGQVALVPAGAQPIILEGRAEYLLGREGQDAQIPVVNLNPYGAREKGVSRKHASLRVDRRQLLLMDLGSTNGTRLNSTPLAANEPVRLENGDEICLGRLALKVYFNL